MQLMEIQPTYNSPHVVLNPQHGTCVFKGKSILIEVNEFYSPLFSKIEDLIKRKLQPKLEFTFDLEYLSIPSVRRFLIFLRRLKVFQKQGGIVKVNWCYTLDDDDSLEMGEYFSQLSEMDFEYIPHERQKAS